MSAKDQSEILRSLQKAHGKVLELPRYLVPREGVTLAYAMKNPQTIKDIAVARGTSTGFGVDEPIVRLLLTAVRFEPDIRAAGIIRHTEEIAQVVTETLKDICEYDPAAFPPGIPSMDWGVASCLRDGAPLALISKKSRNFEPTIKILGTTPEEVANRILIIGERLTYTDI